MVSLRGVRGGRRLVAWAALLSLAGAPGASGDPAIEPEPAGEATFESFGCRGCHSIDGSGGSLAPELDDVLDRRGEEWVREKIRAPRTFNPTSIMPTLPMTDAQLEVIIDFLAGDG